MAQEDCLHLIKEGIHTILRLLYGAYPGLHGHELLALAGIDLLEK